MNNAAISKANWQQLFEAALREEDPLLAADRFHSAKDAIMTTSRIRSKARRYPSAE